MRIPTPQNIDAQWFTEVLGGREVVSFTAQQIGTGQLGKCIRFGLTFDTGETFSLIGKFASDSELSRATGIAQRIYVREVNFYRYVAPELSISIPRCYFADIIDDGPEFAILLEDMHPAVQGNQLAGCSPDIARAAVREVVGLHAPTWCEGKYLELDWLHDSQRDPDAARDLYATLLPGFIDRYSPYLQADELKIIADVAESPTCPIFQPFDSPFSLEHVDYRLDNLLIDSASPTPRITAVDWQTVRVGKPLNDVAYFLGAGLLPDVRREVERDIVMDYHGRLLESGVESYPWEDCWEDYRRGAFAGFSITIVAPMIVEQTQRGDEMFTTMARRHSRHALDLGAREFL